MPKVTPLLAGPVIVPERLKHAGGGMLMLDLILRPRSQVRLVLEIEIGEVQVWVVMLPPVTRMV